MNESSGSSDKLIWFLQERAKELKCLYQIEEALNKPDTNLAQICQDIVLAIPPGWQYPDICLAKIKLKVDEYASPNFRETPWFIHASINVLGEELGVLSVYYTMEMPSADDGPFLKEEKKLVNTIAERIGNYLGYNRMKRVFSEYKTATQELLDKNKSEWRVVLDLLRQTERDLYLRISHKMLNHLCWSGVEEAKKLAQYYNINQQQNPEKLLGEENKPFQKVPIQFSNDFLSDETFKIASDNLSDNEILSFIQRWIQQDKLGFLVKSIINMSSTVTEVADAIRRFQHMSHDNTDIPAPTRKGAVVSLIRRFFSDQLDYINVAKEYMEVRDFFNLLNYMIYTPESMGKLGGKSAGLFLAEHILSRAGKETKLIGEFKVPKTYYMTSDVLLNFMYYNNFEEIVEQKYKDVNQVRIEYPNIVQTFMNAHFPPEIIKAISAALDDFKDAPLIVRSSSLLEDRAGAAFSGKYKSLFLANQGEKDKRLSALLDAIAEVYASTFGPDPIEYRAERGLLDFHEEMGIMIQEVVGARTGKYYMPAFAGVAFSRNEFRWSPRIKRDDGLVRLVMGLGTRAVDRVADDYPILAAPGQPGLRVNVTVEESYRYSPKKIDVINLETNSFETMELKQLFKEHGSDLPQIKKMISMIDGERIRKVSGPDINFDDENIVVTFEGILSQTPFVRQLDAILKTLEAKLGTPIDIEFATDGRDFYLLQCRPQSQSGDSSPAPIPKDIPENRIIFSARKYVSNGRVPDITHIVYVDPEKYSEIIDRASLLAVGRAVGRLNALLPKRQFVLMGPGRWGSRGDVKLGVNVTYSDINNSAVLIEIARKSGNYLPDLSFGTHFFQDLVEAQIRYIPLYPDDPGIIFNEKFLRYSPNVIAEILPEFAYLADTIRLIDIPSVAEGRILQILMNADLDEAIGILTLPMSEFTGPSAKKTMEETHADSFWRWRMKMAERIAAQIEPELFGVKGFYIFGSTKNGTAGPGSDIDVLIHFDGDAEKRKLLETWLNGWSLCLDEMNYQQTGYRSGGLLDAHIITDEDFTRKSSFAVKIGAATDPAKPLPLKSKS